MITLKSRKKTLALILVLWVLIFLGIFEISRYLYTSGFKTLEISFAKESNLRAFQSMISELRHIYLLNLDYAWWGDTYEYVNDRNKRYADKNLITDLFTDNKINFVVMVNAKNEIIWGKGYDLLQKKYMPLPGFLSSTLIKSLSSDIKAQFRAYDVSRGHHGLAGFYKLPDTDQIIYLAINEIHEDDSPKKNGVLIFAKILDKDFFKDLSANIDYPIKLDGIRDFLSNSNNKAIFDYISVNNQTYIMVLNEQYLRSYRLLKNLVGEPIGVLVVDLSRKLYQESERASGRNQTLIFFVSLFAIGFMSTLVALFFRQQDRITKAFEQFFPKNFIQLLNKDDVLSIALGDHVEKEISVLFLDIRNFTVISESMTPAENFKFINDVLGYIAPMVSKNNGFIDKYIGDAVMALFSSPDSHADDAVKSALMMLDALKSFREAKGAELKHEVNIGIGINSGELMLGIIGASGRIEGTAISDTVNTASRIESSTKTYGHHLLIAQNTLDRLKNKDEYVITFVDDLLAKGKSKTVSVYSVYRKADMVEKNPEEA